MHCDNCRCLVTQQEADEAAYIYATEGTLCPQCARQLAEHDSDEAIISDIFGED